MKRDPKRAPKTYHSLQTPYSHRGIKRRNKKLGIVELKGGELPLIPHQRDASMAQWRAVTLAMVVVVLCSSAAAAAYAAAGESNGESNGVYLGSLLDQPILLPSSDLVGEILLPPRQSSIAMGMITFHFSSISFS